MDKVMEVIGWTVCAVVLGAACELYDVRVCIKEKGQCNGGRGNSMQIKIGDLPQEPTP